MGYSISPSQNWALAPLGSIGFVKGVGLMAYYMMLIDLDNQMSYDAWLAGSSVGAGADFGAGGAFFSPTPFKTQKPMYASDIDNSLCGIIDVGAGFGPGFDIAYLKIYGVSVGSIDIGGWFVGLSGGATLSPLMYLYVPQSSAYKAPDPQPIGPNYTPAGPNSSQDPGMSVQPIY